MKYPLLLVLVASVAAAAALGAIEDPSDLGSAASSAPASANLNVDPPWLTAAWQDNLDRVMLAGANPHAAFDPHGGVPAGAESHAGIHMGTDPHAGLAVTAPGASRRTPNIAAPVTVARSGAVNGRSVAEIFAERAALRDQYVTVRGTIVKRMDGILGKTYLHLRDGSGSPEQGDHDLTLTTNETFELGELVEVEGRVLVDHDVGLGYHYPALLASVTRRASPDRQPD